MPAFRARRRRGGVHAGGERLEDRVEPLHRRVLAADHQAVAALQPPDAAARADIDVVDALRLQFGGAADVVVVVGVAAVDDDVVFIEQRQQLLEGLIDRRGGHHQPDGARRGEFADEVFERGALDHTVLDVFLPRLGVAGEADAGMPIVDQPPHHVAAHPPQSDHPELHVALLCLRFRTPTRTVCRAPRRFPSAGSVAGRLPYVGRGYKTICVQRNSAIT